jgi:site-specific recombinase XerD
MLFKAPSERDRLMLELSARTGMRIGEMPTLTLGVSSMISEMGSGSFPISAVSVRKHR